VLLFLYISLILFYPKDVGILHADAKDKADILNRQYQSVFTNEDTSDIPTPDGKPYSSMPEITNGCNVCGAPIIRYVPLI
jgi:hypothetical protein